MTQDLCVQGNVPCCRHKSIFVVNIQATNLEQAARIIRLILVRHGVDKVSLAHNNYLARVTWVCLPEDRMSIAWNNFPALQCGPNEVLDFVLARIGAQLQETSMLTSQSCVLSNRTSPVPILASVMPKLIESSSYPAEA